MDKIYFIDLDGVIVKGGTQELLPRALESLKAIYDSGGKIFYFSCWAFSEGDLNFLHSLVPFEGFIRKPFADEYIYWDDKLRIDLCRNSL